MSIDPRALSRQAVAAIVRAAKALAPQLAATEQWFRVQVNDDGSDTASWPNRGEFVFQRHPAGPGPNTFPPVLTSFFNEYGELRVSPAKGSTVALRVFTRERSSGPAHDPAVNVFEVMDDRDGRQVLAGVRPDGSIVTVAGVTAATLNGHRLQPGVLAAGATPSSPVVGGLYLRYRA